MYNNLDKGIIDICHYEYETFLNKANVVGVGYGYKYIKNIQTNEKVLQVFVEKKVPLNCLCKNDCIPSFYKNIKTDVIETGTNSIRSLNNSDRPVKGGDNIGPAGILICGTYGGLVKDSEGYYMLSNNHVIAVSNLLPIGNAILQPCASKGGVSPKDVVANLTSFIPIKFRSPTEIPVNYVDAAIAEVKDLSIVSPEIKFIGIPKGTKEPELLMSIQMSGETSGLIFGIIVSMHVTTTVRYGNLKFALYKDQIFFTPIVKDGDSGALILDADKNVIGLNFASNQQYSIANPIDNVLKALKVQLVTDK